MTRVLLLNPPAARRVSRDYYCGHVCKGHYYWPQIDLLLLSGRVHEAGCELMLLDAVVDNLCPAEALRRIEAFQPDAVLALTAAISWSEDMSFLADLGRRLPVRLLISGDFPRAEPRRVLASHPWLDGVILDFADCDLMPAIHGHAQSGLRNLYLCGDTEPPQIARDRLFSFPLPRHELFLNRKYRIPQALRSPFTLVITDFGCPYQCDYCYFQRVSHKRRELDGLREELTYIRSLGIRELLIHDPSFAAVKSHGMEVCDVLRGVSQDFSWTCEFRADSADEDLLQSMRAAGCHTLMIGVESPNEEVMAKHRKPQSVVQVERAFSLARRYGFRTLAHFIIGLTGETAASIERLIRFSIELNPDVASFNIARPAWNTGFRDELVANNWLRGSGVEIAGNDCLPVWETPALSRDEMWMLRNEAVRRFYLRPSYVLRQLSRVRTPYQFQTLVREGWQIVADSARHALQRQPRTNRREKSSSVP